MPIKNTFASAPKKTLLYTLSTGVELIASVVVAGGMQHFIENNFDFKWCPDSSILTAVRQFTFNGVSYGFTPYHAWDTDDNMPVAICVQQVISVCDPDYVSGLTQAYLASLPTLPVPWDAPSLVSTTSIG